MPVDPVTALMIAKAVAAGAQYIDGMNEAKNLKRPIAQMPSGVLAAEDLYRSMAGQTRLPGQDAFEAEVDLDFANYASKAMSMGGSPAEGSQYLANTFNQSMREKRRLASEAARYQDAAKMRLAEQENRKAAYEMQLFNINQLTPYMEAARAASAKMGAGLTNLFGTADSAVSYGMSKDFLKEAGLELETAEFDARGGSRGMDIPAPMGTPRSVDGFAFETPVFYGLNGNPVLSEGIQQGLPSILSGESLRNASEGRYSPVQPASGIPARRNTLIPWFEVPADFGKTDQNDVPMNFGGFNFSGALEYSNTFDF